MKTIVTIECDLDAAGVGGSMPFFERLAEDPNDVVLDMRSVALLDGSGLGALLHVFKRKTAQGAKFGLTNISGQPRQLLGDLKVLPLLELEGEAPAIEALQLAPARSHAGLAGDTAIPTR